MLNGVDMLPENALEHMSRYWDRCRHLFAESDYPLAAFCAITLIEEVGKIPMLTLGDSQRESAPNGFRRHETKHASAVQTTLTVNARVSRIYGENAKRFADWHHNGDLPRIRNAALYMELDGGAIVTPTEKLSRETSFLLVCFAGEMLAEIQGFMTGTGPDEWQDILSQVDEFRQKYEPAV